MVRISNSPGKEDLDRNLN